MEEENTGEDKQEVLTGMCNSDGGSMFQGENSVVDFHEPSTDIVKTTSKIETKVLTITPGTLSESLQKMNDSATKKPGKMELETCVNDKGFRDNMNTDVVLPFMYMDGWMLSVWDCESLRRDLLIFKEIELSKEQWKAVSAIENMIVPYIR